MAARQTGAVVTDEGRALLTTREREILSGEADVSDNYRYKVESVVRNRVRKHLGDDVEFLRQNFPEVHEMIVTEACGDAGSDVATLGAELQECRESLRRERSAGGARLDDQSIGRLENALSAAHSALEGSHPSVDQARAEVKAAQKVLQDAGPGETNA